VSTEYRATSLESYLADEYRSDRQEIDSLDNNLARVAATFAETFVSNCWPYEYNIETGDKPETESQGTRAMVLSAIGKLVGTCRATKDWRSKTNGQLKKD
jgi:hypothetical protein